jgi:hypothetical protein
MQQMQHGYITGAMGYEYSALVPKLDRILVALASVPRIIRSRPSLWPRYPPKKGHYGKFQHTNAKYAH